MIKIILFFFSLNSRNCKKASCPPYSGSYLFDADDFLRAFNKFTFLLTNCIYHIVAITD